MLIDTDVAIHWRDGSRAIIARIGELARIPAISVVTLVELQAGIAVDRSANGVRRHLLGRILQSVPVLPFTETEAAAYGAIIAAVGHDRRRVLDRMIAIVARMPLITINGRDFRDIPHLDLEVWPSP